MYKFWYNNVQKAADWHSKCRLTYTADQHCPVRCGEWRNMKRRFLWFSKGILMCSLMSLPTDLSCSQLTKLSWGEFTDCFQNAKKEKNHFWMSNGLSFFYLEICVSLLSLFLTSFSFNPLGVWPDAAACHVGLPAHCRLISFPWCVGFFVGCLLVKPFLFFKTLFIILK